MEEDRIINKPSRWFGMVPAWVCDHTEQIGGAGVAVFTVLCIHASKERRCYPSIPTIARESGFSERTVQETIKKLVSENLISIVSYGTGRGNANLYEVVDKLQLKGAGVAPFSLKGAERVQESTVKGAPVAVQHNQEHKNILKPLDELKKTVDKSLFKGGKGPCDVHELYACRSCD